DLYNFRYRNRLTVERPFKIKKLRLSPYAAGELFWDRNHHAWNENQYAFGIQWPIRKVFKLNTFYLRQNCATCSTDPLSVLGLAEIFYFDWPKKRNPATSESISTDYAASCERGEVVTLRCRTNTRAPRQFHRAYNRQSQTARKRRDIRRVAAPGLT